MPGEAGEAEGSAGTRLMPARSPHRGGVAGTTGPGSPITYHRVGQGTEYHLVGLGGAEGSWLGFRPSTRRSRFWRSPALLAAQRANCQGAQAALKDLPGRSPLTEGSVMRTHTIWCCLPCRVIDPVMLNTWLSQMVKQPRVEVTTTGTGITRRYWVRDTGEGAKGVAQNGLFSPGWWQLGVTGWVVPYRLAT